VVDDSALAGELEIEAAHLIEHEGRVHDQIVFVREDKGVNRSFYQSQLGIVGEVTPELPFLVSTHEVGADVELSRGTLFGRFSRVEAEKFLVVVDG